MCREQETPDAEASLRSSIDRRANTSWKVLALNRLVRIGILPNVNSIKLNRDASSAQSAHSRIGRLKRNQTKCRKRVMTKVKLLLRKVCDSWVVHHRTLSRQNLQRFLGRAQKCWDQFDDYDSRGLQCVNQTSDKIKVRRLGKYKFKFLISEVPTLWNLRTDLQERLQDKSGVPAETRGNLPGKYISSNRKTKLHSIHLLRSGFCWPHPR